MKQTLIIIVSLLTSGIAALADSISADKALAIANSFVGNSVAAKAMKRDCKGKRLSLASQTAGHFVFNIGGGNGYVVVAGDDMASDIVLGYTDNGNFDPDTAPDNMLWWLSEYDRQIDYLRQNGTTYGKATASHSDATQAATPYAEIKPLLHTRWSQESPYNNLCPIISGHRAPTGCVATAIAQIMYYHKWPEHGTGDYYSDINFGWSDMTDTYHQGSSQEAQNAVAQLMATVGLAVDMDYGASSSGATNQQALYGLKHYLGYTKAKMTDRYMMNSAAWDLYIYNELSHSRPVYYTGCTNTYAGHAFVCDGFRDGYFHINWGWGGVSDGYFKTSALNPQVQGTGGGMGGFNSEQSIITYLFNPNDDNQKYLYATAYDGLTTDMQTATANNWLTINGTVRTTTNESGFYLGICVTDDNNTTTYIREQLQRTPEDGKDRLTTDGITIPLNQFPTADGQYEIRPMVYGNDSGTWQEIVSTYETHPTALSATVSQGTIKFYNGSSTTLNVISCNIPETMYANEQTVIKLRARCATDTYFNNTLYLGFRKDGMLTELRSQTDEAPLVYPGKDTDIEFSIKTPNQEGLYDVALFLHRFGENTRISDYFAATVVEKIPSLRLNGNLTIPGQDLTKVNTQNFKVNARVKTADKSFSGELRLIVHDRETDEEVCSLSKYTDITPGVIKLVSFSGSLSNTLEGHIYYAQVCQKQQDGSWQPIIGQTADGTPNNKITFATAITSGISYTMTGSDATTTEVYTINGGQLGNQAPDNSHGIYITRSNGKSVKLMK